MRAANKFLPRRSIEQFEQWLEQFYGEHPAYVKKQMGPVLMSYAQAIANAAGDEIGASGELTSQLEKFIKEYEASFTTRYVGSSRGQMREVLRKAIEKNEDPIPALQERFDEWEERRPGKVSEAETVQLGSAMAKAVWVFAGVTLIRWMAGPSACDLCQELDGMILSVEKTFLQEGKEYTPEGSEQTFTSYVNVGNPPAHEHCGCGIVAEIGE